MRISDLDQIRERYDHVYLSPHLDDAVFSCGGAILRQREAGERVLVVTFCTAAPDPRGPFSALALEFHRIWALDPSEVVAARLREDALAMERIGADYCWAGLLDAIYRAPHAYNTRARLFGALAPDDPQRPALEQIVRALRERAPEAQFYAPLGVGMHVDHQLVYDAARAAAGAPLTFYDDVPYVAKPGALEQRMEQIGAPLAARTVDISATLDRKIHAAHAYASQLDELFGGADEMERVVAGCARAGQSDGAAVERLWE